jgi:protein-disulfide isomerase
MMINRATALLGFFLSFVAGMILVWGLQSRGFSVEPQDAEPSGSWSDEASPISVSSNDPVWGSRSAPVTIVVFSDFECPYCSKVEQTVDQLKSTYGRDTVRVVWKNFPLPFHKSARPAAVAAQSARALGGNAAFWKFHDSAFSHQRDLNRENFEQWAEQAGVKLDKFRQALDESTYAAKVDADLALGRQLGVQSTPHAFINGVTVDGAQPVEKFKEVIDAEIKRAKELQGKGVKPTELYVQLSKNNRASEAKAAAPPATGSSQPRVEQPSASDDTTVWKVPIDKSPAVGGKSALVTLVMFSDFQCPYCKRAQEVTQQLQKDYGDKLRVVWKDRPLPFHNRAEPAAEFVREARKQKGDAGFWAAHAKLFENNAKLENTDLESYAKDLGLDVAKVREAIAKKKYEAEIQVDVDLGDALKASGTPHMFINGRRLVGALPIDAFKKIIDEQMAKAQEVVNAGTPADKVYDKIMQTAVEPAPPPPPEKKEVPPPTKDNPSKGSSNAKVVLQIFSDFQCPYCKRVEETLKQVDQDYGRRIKIVWRNKPLPFHQNAMIAAEAAMEAFAQKGSDGFWKYHGKLFDNQNTPDGLERPALEKYARELGLDATKFKAALDNHTHKDQIDADSKVADTAGISGTPSFTINGYFVNGAQPYREFQRLIELALREAK